jgi:hypothetical protein
MTRRLLTSAATLVALAGFSASAEAQLTCSFAGAAGATCTVPTTHDLTATVVRTGKITISAAGTSVTPVAADYENSESALGTLFGGPTFTVKSNATYDVALTYPAAFTSPSSKPVENVAVQVANVGSCGATGVDGGYTALTAGGATTNIVTGASSTASAAKQLCVKVKWLWTADGPGAYTLPLTFKITAP